VKDIAIARRYARALFELAIEENRLSEVARELSQARAALEPDEIAAALADPAAPREKKLRIAQRVADACHLSPTVANALRLLARRNRLSDLPAVDRAFRELSDERSGLLRARLISAVPVNDAVVGGLSRRLCEATGREVVIERTIDASILGGLVAQVGSKVYDGSLRSQLENLRRQLKG
jgi:F-type H+-transporting ATPase subunit delta